METIAVDEVEAKDLKFKVSLRRSGGTYPWRWEVRVSEDGGDWTYGDTGSTKWKFWAKREIRKAINEQKLQRNPGATEEWIVDASTGLTDDQLQRQFDRLQRELRKRESRK